MSQPQPESQERLAAIAASLARAVRELEDADDVMDADAAWDEPGESIPLADLEAEFGRG